MDSIKDKWAMLEQDALNGTGHVQRQVFAGAPLPLFAVMEQGTRRRVFRFCITDAVNGGLRQLNNSTGLDVSKFRSPEDYGPDKVVHQVALTDNSFADLFDVLLQDVCERVAATTTELEATNVIINRIVDWQRFLMLQGPDGLSDERQRGLYGELVFLRRLCGEGILQNSGIGCWRGPSGADQDFHLRTIGVESKVSLSAQNQELVVSSERQLDGRGDEQLFVAHLALSTRRQQGETLTEIVDDLRMQLPGNCRGDFELHLFDAGFLDAHRECYEQFGYIVREENFFEVRDEFPRICENELRTGVGKVRYCISVAACKQFSISAATLLGAIKKLYA